MNTLSFDLHETEKLKVVKSPEYNYSFNKETGFFARWGKTLNDDPIFSPFGCEILDMEICAGECLGNCDFCYKCNGSNLPPNNMTLKTFKNIVQKIPRVLTQIAFGITDIYANPDFFEIMKHSAEQGIIPNYTCHGLDVDSNAVELTARYCGAVAISLLDKDMTFNAIENFTQAGMDQVNIHFMLSKETYDKALKLAEELKEDERTKNLNAVVFLQYKSKGEQPDLYSPLKEAKKYAQLIDTYSQHEINIGFDSCSAPVYLKGAKLNEINKHRGAKTAEEISLKLERLATFVEPCESGLFSLYCNVDGLFYPCSFVEDENGWEQGLELKDNFLKDIWYHERMVEWRNELLNTTENCDCQFKSNCRTCPIYDLVDCK